MKSQRRMLKPRVDRENPGRSAISASRPVVEIATNLRGYVAKTKDTEAHRKTIGATLIPRLPIPAINYVGAKRVEGSAGFACPVSIFTGYSHPVFSRLIALR